MDDVRRSWRPHPEEPQSGVSKDEALSIISPSWFETA